MKHCNDFSKDLVFGNEGEKEVAEKIFEKPVNSIEVKKDKVANATGNIFLEYESRGKLSGIMKTEADVIFYAIDEFPGGIYLYADGAREIIEHYKPTLTREGGDNDTSKGILINITKLFTTNLRRLNIIKNRSKAVETV
jgi:hypothetical protein